MAPRTTIFLIRHGARFDYANKEAWMKRCQHHGHEACDPPLSALGHSQARETAAELAKQGSRIDCILSSPYLRVLQTAQPLAHALQLPICVDNALAEYKHEPRRIPGVDARIPFFPEVDDQYEQLLAACHADPGSGREPPVEYMRRMLLLARELPGRYAGKTVACFSHAASVALVAALTGCGSLQDAGCFAPCGIWELVSDDGGGTWQVQRRGEDNSGYITRNDPTTFPWGFKHSSSGGFVEVAWVQARALGPTTTTTCSRSAAMPANFWERPYVEGSALLVAYLLMWLAQSKGGLIIELLHGQSARKLAEAPPMDVAADAPLDALCRGYVSHHYEPNSNCLHAAGMLLSFALILQALLPSFVAVRPCCRSYVHHLMSSLAWTPPLYYLYAWVGHFVMQADIPAVFTYGMTFRGWACGELCSVWALFTGRTVAQPIELLATVALMALHLALLPPLFSHRHSPGRGQPPSGSKVKVA